MICINNDDCSHLTIGKVYDVSRVNAQEVAAKYGYMPEYESRLKYINIKKGLPPPYRTSDDSRELTDVLLVADDGIKALYLLRRFITLEESRNNKLIEIGIV